MFIENPSAHAFETFSIEIIEIFLSFCMLIVCDSLAPLYGKRCEF